MAESRFSLVETLRDRVLRGLQAGTLEPGERLPSARDLVAEFGVDHRLVLAAYRQLADEGLVEIRKRGGVYVMRPSGRNAFSPALPISWFASCLAEGVARGIPAGDLSEWLRRSIATVRLRAVVISSTEDQVAGLARELREDFGLIADGVTAAALQSEHVRSSAIARADLLVTTVGQAEAVKELASALAKPHIVIDVRPDLVAGEWTLLLRQPVWVIVATPQFGEMLRQFFAHVPGAENLNILVHGRDDLSQIPPDAPTYVTHRVREAVGVLNIRGRLVPAARTISTESARALFDFIARANLRAMQALNESPSPSTSRRA